MKIRLQVNGSDYSVEVAEDMPLLWVIRDFIGLTGTKYGCGRGVCGACSVIVDNQLFRSCVYPARLARGKKITTIEGLASESGNLHSIQQAWVEENVVQCGYCQPGFIIATLDLLNKNPNPNTEDIKYHINNICRCGTYPRIIKAIKRASQTIQHESRSDK